MPATILLIDDEEQLRKLLGRIIGLEGFAVAEAGSLKAATDWLRLHQADAVLCDVRLPDGNGVDFVKNIRQLQAGVPVILLTAYGNIADGVQAIKNGAFDYIVKGNDNDRIIPLLHQALEQVQQQRKSVADMTPERPVSFETIAGSSAAIGQAREMARRIAGTDSTVLLLGETGTGKEVFAQAIHAGSKRAGKPFVAINCSAFSRELLESELFGHKAGAFTGAVKDKKGLIELAGGGTLFLDEIGEMQTDLQAKLLRVLENGEYIKVGDSRISKADVRIIAATNRSLQQQIEEGAFREDLFYRLNIFSIALPPLRERPDDIPALCNILLQQLKIKTGGRGGLLTPAALRLLQQYGWKGNIRELKNVLERALVLMDDGEIKPEHLPYEIQQAGNSQPGLSLAAVEKMHIRKILAFTQGNKAKAARLLEIGLATLYRKMEEYQIR
ncbi:MAG: sigma-54-dependent Fis family transcriptional regulator [Sphingobacteriales bacterium]|nr:sigma-54-dependent Fis family transcriptional regulator [Sphingobacteriales bacterium]OJW31083.1 MAG: sigma-54-dependent Fis family transcriptional regulator [Sphingobacteriales bacterium 46-32]